MISRSEVSKGQKKDKQELGRSKEAKDRRCSSTYFEAIQAKSRALRALGDWADLAYRTNGGADEDTSKYELTGDPVGIFRMNNPIEKG